VNLFHSFGNFNVPNNNAANFLNNSGLPTSNILGRVTGGNASNIFGTIQTTGFGNANLFLMNPAGFLFGPNATVNIGGMATFTSADTLRLADGGRFNAKPNARSADILTAAPVAAFGFIGKNPGAISVQGSQLVVAEGTGISLIGGEITVQDAVLKAPSGQINLVSVKHPSNSHVGGEVLVAASGQGSGFTPTGFKTLGTIALTQGSTIDASAPINSSNTAGSVVIRGGQFVMDSSIVKAVNGNAYTGSSGGSIEVTAERVAISNHSTVTTSTENFISPDINIYDFSPSPGPITFNANTFSATDSTILARALNGNVQAVTIQGLQGSGSFAHEISLVDTVVSTFSLLPDVIAGTGPVLLQANNIALSQSTLESTVRNSTGGSITLVSRGALDIQNSRLTTDNCGICGVAGTIKLNAGRSINITNTSIGASGPTGGTIAMDAPIVSLRGSALAVEGVVSGLIRLSGTKAVSLNGSVLNANGHLGSGGTIQIDGGARFTSEQSTISALSDFGGSGGIISLRATKVVSLSGTRLDVSTPSQVGGIIQIDAGALFTSQQSTLTTQSNFQLGPASGGSIQVKAKKIELTDTLLTTSHIPLIEGTISAGGTIALDAKNTTLTNSQILSTSVNGPGGIINIRSPRFHQNASSVIDASSQFGPDGTVTINGVIQP
jgi:filamentous hemagglutinin family protein